MPVQHVLRLQAPSRETDNQNSLMWVTERKWTVVVFVIAGLSVGLESAEGELPDGGGKTVKVSMT